jgi:hypothetical protein
MRENNPRSSIFDSFSMSCALSFHCVLPERRKMAEEKSARYGRA